MIPSRVNPGKFYALPQAPQQYKQLLMVGGVDKYFQIAPCFRDEDPRADRHSCEFYQVDAEMSFVHQDDVFAVAESYATEMVTALVPHKTITVDFARISYDEAMQTYGSDKPDLRFGMEFCDLSELARNSGFSVFSAAVAESGIVKAIKLDQQTMTRKELDEITEVAKQAGAGGLAYLIFEEKQEDVEYVHPGVRSPIAKFLSAEEIADIQDQTNAEQGDILFFAAGAPALVHKVLNKVRLYCRDKYELADPNELAFCWITDFPFYEYDEARQAWDFGHNPFSHVVGGVEALKTKDCSEIQTNQYDLVLNGYEILSGSIRNHNPEVMVAAFEKLGLSEADVKERFGAMYEAFQYGAPPHGGFAFGFDRLMMILIDEPSIRECYAFPKSGKAEDVMM
ncbi:MAG: aspartate--tRNA ligase [Candidatus Peribacteria bacterium]|nr:MAG: aspartate--tRNA ligase [Candidatus Peribacteria bacterium]